MISKVTKPFLLLLVLQLLLPARLVLADTGPKPTMDFQFQQEMSGEPVTITSGVMYECEQSDCRDGAPLQQLGPQGFSCEATSCYAMSYGFSPYHRLEIQFSDGQMRQSNIFETAAFDSKYTVTVRPDDLLVEAQFNLDVFPGATTVAAACFCAAAGLGLAAGVVLFLARRSKKN